MDASAARLMLLAQHHRIRGELARCVELAQRLCRGEVREAVFDEAIEQLRFDVADHNTTETQLISHLLRGSAGWGDELLERMVDEHGGAHHAFWTALVGSPLDVATRMRAVADELQHHMAAEERTFLSREVLRDDVIRQRRRDGAPR